MGLGLERHRELVRGDPWLLDDHEAIIIEPDDQLSI